LAQVLSPLMVDFLWEALDGGELPYPLEVRSHGATMDERAALRRRLHEELGAQGLLDRSGRLEPRIEEWLGALARPEVSIDSVCLPNLDAEPVRALASAGRGTAVLAVQTASGLRLGQIPRSGLISAILELLPPARRGTETSISLPAEEFAAAGPGTVLRGNPARASATETRQALRRLTAMPNLRGGQIAVNSRDAMRGRRRSPVLAWFDNESGRYLSQARVASDGREWVTVAPADAPTLHKRISEMMTGVTDRGHGLR
jgi:hypothetical protein